MHTFMNLWNSTQRGLRRALATLITAGLVALLAPGCGGSAPEPKPGEPGGGPKMEDAAGIKEPKKVISKPDDDSITAKRARRKAGE